MALTSEQRKVVSRILARARKVGASPMEIESAIETGLVESGLRNLNHGDRDSKGWRQERGSLYKDPTNLDASIARYFQETKAAKQRKRYTRSGDLAADVQRPAAQYRGRYEQRDQDAEAILRELGKGDGGSRDTTGGIAPTTRTRTEATFDQDAYKQAQQKQVFAALLERRRGPKGSVLLRTGAISSAPVDPAAFQGERQVTERVPSRRSSGSGSGGRATGGSPLFELFHDPIGGYKHGKSIGPIGGHGGHVHVAAGPKTVIRLGKLAEEKYGLTVRENPHWDKVDPVHTKGSYHYSRRAIDVSGDPKAMRRYARDVLRQYGSKR